MRNLGDDIVITWPKSRSLQSYLDALDLADHLGLVINFRVPSLPTIDWGAKCYAVHDGYIRGYNQTKGCRECDDNTVFDTETGKYWPAGKYLVRDPKWHPIDPVPMKGFQGYRYIKLP